LKRLADSRGGRGLILAILKGELTDEDDVAKWIDVHHTSEMPINGYMVPD
jgi:hypothetical protein